MTTNKPVGLTASVGFQVGVRRTLPVSQEQAWELLTDAEGLTLWLGQLSDFALQAGTTFFSSEGIQGELRIVRPFEQLRLSWKKQDWEQPSTLQIRFLAKSPVKTTISFHQEKLADANCREEMKHHWEQVLTRVEEKIGSIKQ